MKFPIDSAAISDDVIARCRSFKDAIRFCIDVSELERKEVASELGIRENMLSRMLADNEEDNRYFPPDKLNDLMDICGNEIPIRWLALSRGFGLVRLRTSLELDNEELKKRLDEKEYELETLKSFLRGLSGAACDKERAVI